MGCGRDREMSPVFRRERASASADGRAGGETGSWFTGFGEGLLPQLHGESEIPGDSVVEGAEIARRHVCLHVARRETV